MTWEAVDKVGAGTRLGEKLKDWRGKVGGKVVVVTGEN